MGLARWMDLRVVAEGVETREQLERLKEIGCDYVQGYYFARPMPSEEFESLLKRQDSTKEETEAEASSLGSTSLSGYILVAEEDDAYRNQICSLLRNRFKIIEAVTGKEALGFIVRYERELSGVVLSLTLPELSGFSVLEILQREKAVWNIPVVATAPPDPRTEDQAVEMGADDFAYKPCSAKIIERRLINAMERSLSYESRQTLHEDACRDYLTGLLNRRGLNAAVRIMKKEDAPMAVFLFDIDNLKQVNETLGHSLGDRLLKKFGDLLHARTRSNDILARFGGDEFLVIMRQMGSEETALKKGEEICGGFQNAALTDQLPISCTCGAVIWNNDVPLDNIISQADKALYQAKLNGKGGCSVRHQSGLSDSSNDRQNGSRD